MGLGVDITSRFSKTPVKRPYITVLDSQPSVPGPSGSRLEDGGPSTLIETVMLDVWQDFKSRASAGGITENMSIVPTLLQKLEGGRPVDSNGHPLTLGSVPNGRGIIYRCRVRSDHKLTDPTVENIVHNAITLEVWRQF